MTETPESSSESTATAADRGAVTAGRERPSRLSLAAAAVGIVAGVVFIVGVVFFSGFFLGSYQSGPQVMRCEMGGSGEGKGGMGGMGPGGMGPMGPSQPPSQPPSSTSTAPPAPSTPRP
jgi:hypothetical protein